MGISAPGGSDPLYLVENPMKSKQSAPLLLLSYLQVNDDVNHNSDRTQSCSFLQVDKKSPVFASRYNKVEKDIKIEGQPLNVNLHQEALVDVQNFVQTLQKKLDELQKANQPPPSPEPPKPKLERATSRVSTTSSSKSARAGKLVEF